LILSNVLKIVDFGTRCQILTQNCTKFDFGLGSTPGPAGEANTAPNVS